jgi:flagellar L-ring protein precursor FlgH
MRSRWIAFRSVAVLALCGVSSTLAFGKPAQKKSSQTERLRAEYVARLQKQYVAAADEHTVGSLWSADSSFSDFAADYKARHLNDTITILVAVQTSAAQSGTVGSQRTFTDSSAVTGVLGKAPANTNPLLAANSSSTLNGKGTTASNTAFTTSLTGQVIAVLPNGNLVVEAERKIFMNNQHEDVLVRGMVRPGDISPSNTVASTSLSNLEIEMKGKGIIADSVRRPNILTRTLQWLFNF